MLNIKSTVEKVKTFIIHINKNAYIFISIFIKLLFKDFANINKSVNFK